MKKLEAKIENIKVEIEQMVEELNEKQEAFTKFQNEIANLQMNIHIASKVLEELVKLNEDESWELVYDTLSQVIKTYKNYTFESEKNFKSFVFTIFCNKLL